MSRQKPSARWAKGHPGGRGGAKDCPWRWCNGDDAKHELLCLTSKVHFDVS
jgi:hypothetical protein